MKNDNTAVGRNIRFDHVENSGSASDAVNREDFTSGFGATFEDPLEYLSLNIEGLVETGAGIDPDLTDISCLGKMALPYPCRSFECPGNQGVEAGSHAG